MGNNRDIPENFKVIKPWGSEYTIYKNSITTTKLLKIFPNKQTSLHCHPIKKTGFILLDGEVNVDVGFYDKKILKSISKLMIRPGLFHRTEDITDKIATILEIETPIDIDDLVRFKDDYGRKDLPYEGKNNMEKIRDDDIVFTAPELNSFKKYEFLNSTIKIQRTNEIESLKNAPKNEIFCILDGGLYAENDKVVLSPGDIVKTDTIKKLAEVFNIKNELSYLSINYEK